MLLSKLMRKLARKAKLWNFTVQTQHNTQHTTKLSVLSMVMFVCKMFMTLHSMYHQYICDARSAQAFMLGKQMRTQYVLCKCAHSQILKEPQSSIWFLAFFYISRMAFIRSAFHPIVASPTFERTRGLFTQPTSQQLFHLNFQNVRYLIHITFSVNFLNSYLHGISNEVYEINYLVVRQLATKSIKSKTMESVNVFTLDQNTNKYVESFE